MSLLVGALRGAAVERLRLMILAAIVVELADELLVDLAAVTFLSTTGAGVTLSPPEGFAGQVPSIGPLGRQTDSDRRRIGR